MDAAKIAASLYVDAVSDGDGIGVVSFSGDENECNEDAEDDGTGLGEANWLKRLAMKLYIDDLSSGGMTAIGDGLWLSQDLLDSAPAVPDTEMINTTLLVSDGVQNEWRHWGGITCSSDVKLSFFGRKVDTSV